MQHSDEVAESYRLQGPPDGIAVTDQGPAHRKASWPRTFRVEVADLPGWRVEVEVQPLELGLGITSLTVSVGGDALPSAGLSSSDAKRLRLARILEAITFDLETTGDALTEYRHQSGDPDGALSAEVGAIAEARRPGRAPHAPETLRFIAELRLSAETRRSHKPNEEIAALLSTLQDRPVTAASVASLVGKATKAGWLGPAGSGRSLRTPGPRLIAARAAEPSGSI